ncbi:hypothetical protein ABIB35_001035 [Arthrobacter sp. UYP6]
MSIDISSENLPTEYVLDGAALDALHGSTDGEYLH